MALGSLFVPEPVWLATDEGRSPWRHLRSIGSVAMAAGRLLPQWRLPAFGCHSSGKRCARGRALRRAAGPAGDGAEALLPAGRRLLRQRPGHFRLCSEVRGGDGELGAGVRGGATGRGRGRGAGGHSARKGMRAHLRGLRAAHGTPRLRPRARWHLCAAGSLSGWWLQNLWGSGSSLEESSLPPFSKCPRDFKYPGSQRVLAVRLFI